MKILKKVMIWFLIISIGFVATSNIVGYVISAPGYKGSKSDHFNGKTFQNYGNVKAKGLADVLKWSLNRKQGEWKEVTDFKYGEKPLEKVAGSELKVTFINHATVLLQTRGLNILTDPIWSERTSPVEFAGPKRKVPPGIRFEDLPKIDIVILSHNHYDHLDAPTIERLQKAFNPQFYVPLGVSAFLQSLGVEKTVEMDWWNEEEIVHDIKLACVPAQHFSGRGTYDRDKTLWAGYVLAMPEGNIYFAGDTGYGNFFTKIGEKYGPFRLSLIPIGAYKPKWFMSPIHISPEEAVKVHEEVKSEKSMAIHFGTFPLADDGMFEPVEDLQKAKEKHNIGNDEFVALKNGEAMVVN